MFLVLDVYGDSVDSFSDFESAHSFCEKYRRSLGTCYMVCPDKDIEYPACW